MRQWESYRNINGSYSGKCGVSKISVCLDTPSASFVIISANEVVIRVATWTCRLSALSLHGHSSDHPCIQLNPVRIMQLIIAKAAVLTLGDSPLISRRDRAFRVVPSKLPG